MRFEDNHPGTIVQAVEESWHLLGDNATGHEGWW